MLALLVPILLLLFLTIGGMVFVVCAALPPLRRYALSAALWCAMWGPCVTGLIVLAGTAMVFDVSLTQKAGVSNFHLPHLSAPIGWALGAGIVLTIAAVASGVAWLHQAAIHRLTFALFRLYATVVCGGIGGAFGVWLGWWLIGEPIRFAPFFAIAEILLLMVSFGAAAYRGARSLRGSAPTAFSWITEQEFNGI
jgi:hypothetical protein